MIEYKEYILQQAVAHEFKKTMDFLEYSKNFLIRHNLLQEVLMQAIAILKDMLSCRKKLKIAKYRVNYQMYKLQEMEKLIAENNSHNFLQGSKLNHLR